MTDAALAFMGALCEAGKGDFLSIDLPLLIVGRCSEAELARPGTHYMHGYVWVSPNGHLVPVGMKGNA